jgi:hypothetical protein
MAAPQVNLDALIPREDFATESVPFRGTPSGTLSLGQLSEDSFFVSSLRKPDFQRETANWTPQKVVDLVTAFLDGDLIPAIILWRSGQYVFVIDGAHRLSALLAWLYDDYGDRSRSIEFFDNQVPEEQKKLAEQTRKLVANTVGPYSTYKDLMRKPALAPEHLKERLGQLSSNSFTAQWVPADNADAAEKSFFKINQAPTPVDPVEKRILKTRTTAAAIAARAINRGGVGHKYWGHFESAEIKAQIEKEGREIHDALYLPPMGDMPLKSSDVPVGGRGYNSLPFVFDLVTLLNGVPPKENLPPDPDGNETLEHMRVVKKRVERITTTMSGSLGLHPLVYFYTRGGAFQPVAFLAVAQFVGRLVEKNRLDAFTKVRRAFEQFLMKHKEAFTLIVKRQGAGGRSRPAIEDFLDRVLDGFVQGKSQEEVLESLSADPRFSFLMTPAPIREPGATNRRTFSATVKTATFISSLEESGIRCGICGGLLHRNSIHTDHVKARSKGGEAHTGNAQLAHPYCDSSKGDG